MADSGHTDSSPASERAPTLDGERLFTSYSSFFYTVVAIASAIWVILVGSAIPAVGDTKLGIIGFACGTVLGTVLVAGSVGLPALRYGVDSIEISKAALGIRGSALALVGLMIMGLGWSGVALALIARGSAGLIASVGAHPGVVDEHIVVAVGLLLIPVLFLLVRHGLDLIRRINDIAGPALLLLACLSLFMLWRRYGFGGLLGANVPAGEALTTDRLKSFAYAIEFGLTMSVTWWPYAGGLYRFLRFRQHAVGPFVIGGALVGTTLSATVAALASVHLGSPDPSVWLITLTGPVIGPLLVTLVLILGLPAICMLVFIVASAAQQLPPLARTSWDARVLFSITPLALVALNTSWTLTHVVTVATFGSLVFFGICAIVLVDFWVLRKGRITLPHLFVEGAKSHYWYTGGINWVAMLTVALSCIAYLYLYDPISLSARPAFRYAGAALPVMAGSALLYLMAMRMMRRYRPGANAAEPEPEYLKVGL